MRRRALLLPVALAAACAAACGGGGGGGDLEAFCDTARAFSVDNPAGVLAAHDPADPATTAERLRVVGDRFRAWADDAPGEAAADVVTVADAAEELAAAFADGTGSSGSPSPERLAELEELAAEAEVASARLTAYVGERCGVDLDAQAP